MKKRLFICIIAAVLFAFSAALAAGTLRLPDKLKTIEAEAFYEDDSLYDVIIPNGVTSIGERAFANSSVKIIYFPSSITYIADNAFSGVSSWKAYAAENSYAAKWCRKKNIELLNPAVISASSNLTLLSGTITEGSYKNDSYFKGTIVSYSGIKKVVFDLYMNDTRIETSEITVNGETFDLINIGDKWNKLLHLLPTGSYRMDVSVTLNNGEVKNKWKSSSFTVAAPSGISEAKAFDKLFSVSTSTSSASLRKTSMEMANAAYNKNNVVTSLKKNGFTHVDTNYYTSGTHTCGVAIGWKNILDANGKPKRLVAVICRGTQGDMFKGSPEWSSNFAVGTGTYHHGFYVAATNVFDWLSSVYLDDMLYKEGLSVNDIMIWTTGHSRGAAVSNLLAGVKLNGLIPDSQVYCYTYATPNVVQGGNKSKNNIHNYIIGGDLVARVPLNAWGYGRFGQNHIYHNGETIGNIAVIDEGTMTKFCNAISSRSILSMLQSHPVLGVTEFLSELEGAVLSDLNNISVIGETIGYIGNTHQQSTYIKLASGVCDSGYWSGSYMKIDADPAPKDFKGTASAPGVVKLSWTSSGSNAYYEIRYDKANVSGWANSRIVRGTSCEITGLEPNTNYAFDITSMQDNKRSKRSETIHVKTKNITLKSTGTTTSSVSLSWDAASGYSSYEIRYDKKGTSGWRWSKTVSGTSTTITGLMPGTDYAFDICAVKGSTKTDRSKTIYATTVGYNLKAAADSPTSAKLTWNAVEGASSFEIRYEHKGKSGWRWSKTVSGTSATISGLDADQAYAFDICAIMGGSKTDRSPTVYATTPKLKTPAKFWSSATAETSVTLSWSAVPEAKSYEIRYDYKGASGWKWQKTTTGTSITITGLVPGSNYAFDICSVRETSKSDRSATIYASTPKLLVPSGFRCTGKTETSVTLAWNAVSGADAYEIRYDYKNATGWQWSKTVKGTSVTITGLKPGSNFAFDICTVLEGHKSARSDTIYASTPSLAIPSSFRSTGKTGTSVTLAWDGVSAADSYEVRYDYKGASGWKWSKSVTGTSVTISGLVPDKAYAFDICSVKNGQKSGRSATIYVTTAGMGLKATADSATSVKLTWNAIEGASSYEIRYEHKGKSGWRWSRTVTGTSTTITGLDINQAYAFDICATINGQKTDRSPTVYATTYNLTYPSKFWTSGTTETSISLSWSASSGATSYEIRYDYKGASGWSWKKTVSGTSTTITGLTPGKNYAFDICAIRDGKMSSRSDTIYASTPNLSIPGNFRGTGKTETSVTLAWNGVSAADSYEIRYEYKGVSGWRWSKSVTGTSVTISGLVPDKAYAFDICSVKNGQKSGRSATIYVTTNALKIPSSFRTTSISETTITLGWSSVAGAASYEIRYDKKGASGWANTVSTSGTSIQISGLNPDTAYAFDIRAVRSGSASGRSATIYATTKKLNTPSGFKSTGTTVSSVSLSWSAVSGAGSYEIRYDKKGTSGWRYSKTVTGTSTTITGLNPDTAYAFDICSVKNGKISGRSATIYATTKPLSKPTRFAGSSNSTGSVTLTWNAVSGGVDGYRIRYDLKGTWGWDYSTTSTGTSKTIYGLKSGKTYAFQILSYYGSSEGSWTDTIYVTVK